MIGGVSRECVILTSVLQSLDHIPDLEILVHAEVSVRLSEPVIDLSDHSDASITVQVVWHVQ